MWFVPTVSGISALWGERAVMGHGKIFLEAIWRVWRSIEWRWVPRAK